MRPTNLLRASHYKPMIKFIGSRKGIEHPVHKPAPHPCAPSEIKDAFPAFLSRIQESSPSSSSSSNGKSESGPVLKLDSEFKGSSKQVDFENFWEAPSYLWVPKELGEREMDSVMSGGATDIRTGP